MSKWIYSQPDEYDRSLLVNLSSASVVVIEGEEVFAYMTDGRRFRLADHDAESVWENVAHLVQPDGIDPRILAESVPYS